MSWNRARFDQFIKILDLKHFPPHEFLIHTNRPGNHPPDDSIWHNIALTAKILDEVRKYFNRPTIITSCYRARDYNRRVGGGGRSQHLAFTAVDFVVSGVSAPDVFDVVKSWHGSLIDIPFWLYRREVEVPEGRVPYREIPISHLSSPESNLKAMFIGGVGRYPTFTHLDTRGIRAVWGMM